MSNLQIIKKAVEFEGNTLELMFAEINGVAGTYQRRVAEWLGTSEGNISHNIKNNGLDTCTVFKPDHRALCLLDPTVFPIKANKFIPESTIRDLVKLVNTPKAWAIHAQLWGTAKAVSKGEILPEQKATVDAIVATALAEVTPLLPLKDGRLVFTSEYLRTLANFMQEQEELITSQQAKVQAAEEALGKQYNVVKLLSKRIESRDAEILDRQWYPLEYVKKEAPPAATISRECPHIWAEAMVFKKQYGKHKKGYEDMNDNGWVTQYLKVVHNVKSNIQEMVPPPNLKDEKTGRYNTGDSGKRVPRFLYNRADVNRVEILLAKLANNP